MYKAGDKFIIEIGEVYIPELPFSDKLYKIKGFNSLVFDDNGLSKLRKLEEVKCEVAFKPFEKGTVIKTKAGTTEYAVINYLPNSKKYNVLNINAGTMTTLDRVVVVDTGKKISLEI